MVSIPETVARTARTIPFPFIAIQCTLKELLNNERADQGGKPEK